MYVQCCFTLLHNGLALSKHPSPTVTLLIVECWPNISSLLWKNRASFWENVVWGGGPARLVRKHLHNGKAQWDLKSQLVDTFPHQRAAKRRRTHTHSAYGEKVGKVQEPFASHISCMTAFHHRGQLRQEVGSYICEVLTAKCCRNGAEYFLALLWHRDTKQLHCISGSLLCGNFRCVCAQTSPTCLWLWRDNGPVKTMSRHRSFSVLHSITESLSDSENPRTERWLNLKRANCPLCPTCSQYTKR